MPTKTKSKRWSSQEELDLAINCTSMTVKELAKKMHRSYASVNWKLTQLHLNQKAREEEVKHSTMYVSNQPYEDPRKSSRKTWFSKFLDFFRG